MATPRSRALFAPLVCAWCAFAAVPHGPIGTTGATGTAGTNGTNGSIGATGATGATGPKGSSVTASGELTYAILTHTPTHLKESWLYINHHLVKRESGENANLIRIKRPSAQRFTLEIRYQLSNGEVVTLTAVYNRSRHSRFVHKELAHPRRDAATRSGRAHG